MSEICTLLKSIVHISTLKATYWYYMHTYDAYPIWYMLGTIPMKAFVAVFWQCAYIHHTSTTTRVTQLKNTRETLMASSCRLRGGLWKQPANSWKLRGRAASCSVTSSMLSFVSLSKSSCVMDPAASQALGKSGDKICLKWVFCLFKGEFQMRSGNGRILLFRSLLLSLEQYV